MSINDKLVHLNLRKAEGQVVMSVSRRTVASERLGLSCGDVFPDELTAIKPVTVESSQLSSAEFRAWFDAKGLDVVAFGKRYGITSHQVAQWLWDNEKPTS